MPTRRRLRLSLAKLRRLTPAHFPLHQPPLAESYQPTEGPLLPPHPGLPLTHQRYKALTSETGEQSPSPIQPSTSAAAFASALAGALSTRPISRLFWAQEAQMEQEPKSLGAQSPCTAGALPPPPVASSNLQVYW